MAESEAEKKDTQDDASIDPNDMTKAANETANQVAQQDASTINQPQEQVTEPLPPPPADP